MNSIEKENVKIYTITLRWYTTLFHMHAIYYFAVTVEDDSKVHLSGVGEWHRKIENRKEENIEWTTSHHIKKMWQVVLLRFSENAFWSS